MGRLAQAGGRDEQSASAAVNAWRARAETAHDEAHKEMLRLVVTQMQQQLGTEKVESALIGGTALRLVHGLPRPSKDIDMKVARHIPGGEQLAVDAVNSIPGWSARRATMEEFGRGRRGILVTNEESGAVTSTEVQLLEGAVNAWDTEGVNAEWLVVTRGIRTYPIDILARLKLATLIGERPRAETKDIVDAIWLMEEHGHLVSRDNQEMLRAWTTSNRHNEGARAKFKANGAGSWNEAMDDLDRAIDESGATLDQGEQLARMMQEVHRQTGDARLGPEVDGEGRISVKVLGAERSRTTFGSVRNTKVLAIALAATEGLTKREIPEIVRTLEKERQRQLGLARAKTR